jgi:3'-phosphoadenosine 5'-phosphosulfate sulfotransferase (PAPS reductase)/FAD synthetase
MRKVRKTLVVRVMPDVRLDSYDWIVVNSSAGKDSQAMLSSMVARCDAEGVDRSKIVVAHADLGRIEWDGTKDLARLQAEILGVRFEAVARPQGDLLDHIESRGMWPDSQARYCTSDHKRGQVDKILTALAAETRAHDKRRVRILNCMGLRAQESAGRASRLGLEHNKRATNKSVRYVDNYYPILDWTEHAVWSEIARSGLPHHRAYDLGMTRLSCVFCVFAPKSMLMIAGEHNRALLDEYVAVEDRIDHTFRKGFKIAEVRDALDRGETFESLGDEDIKCWNM